MKWNEPEYTCPTINYLLSKVKEYGIEYNFKTFELEAIIEKIRFENTKLREYAHDMLECECKVVQKQNNELELF